MNLEEVTPYLILIPVLVLIVGIYRLVVARKTYKIAKSKEKSEKSNFEANLIDNRRLILKKTSQRYLFFKIEVKNLSISSDSFKVKLIINYKDNSNTNRQLILHHEENKQFEKYNFTTFKNSIRIEARDMKQNWVSFHTPNNFNPTRIEKYVIKVEDVYNNSAELKSHLLKDEYI
jgi:hypothetical protein